MAGRWSSLIPFGIPVVLAIVLGVQSGRLLLALVSPQAPAGEPPKVDVVTTPAMLSGEFDPFFRTQAAGGSSVVTALPIKLFGTRLDGATGRGFAIIATPDGVQSSFAVGELIMPGVKLVAVARDEVTLDRNGARERLFLDQSTAPSPGTAGAPASLSLPPSLPSIPTVTVPSVANNGNAPLTSETIPAMPVARPEGENQ